jgi:hypothetical protein
MGDKINLDQWRDSNNQSDIEAATDAIMDEITKLLEILRGESAPKMRFDPKKSDLPRTGNFKRVR